MADTYTVKGYDGSAWDITISGSDYIAFCGEEFGDKVSVGAFQDSTHKSNSDITIDGCSSAHMRNCKYESSTEVSLNGGSAVELNTTNVTQTDCTIRASYQDTLASTELEDILFFAYDGVSVVQAPSGVTVCAFEVTSGGINTDRQGDTPGDGNAWDEDEGIGGLGNALELSDQNSSSVHYFYLGISVKPTSKGSKSATLRIEFSAS